MKGFDVSRHSGDAGLETELCGCAFQRKPEQSLKQQKSGSGLLRQRVYGLSHGNGCLESSCPCVAESWVGQERAAVHTLKVVFIARLSAF